MSKFLFTVWPFAGHLHPAIAVGNALKARGHQIAFYTGASVRSVVEQEGFEFFPFQRVDEERVTAITFSEFPYTPSLLRRLRNARRTGDKFREWLLDTIPSQVDDIDGVLSEWRPHALVTDFAFWSPILVLRETRQIPVAVLSVLAACFLPGPDVPFWGLGWPRPRNTRMRLRSQIFAKASRLLSIGFRRQVNAVRRKYSLSPLDCTVTEYIGRMPLYLVPSIREYDYNRRDLPPSVQYVGPCLWDNPDRVRSPDWLTRMRGDQPLVYVTEATVGTSQSFLLKAAARALADMPVQVVMTTGKQRNPAELGLGVLSANIRIERYVPQSVLLPKTAAMVTVGGSGGVLAALKAGVPLVIAPTEWDRPENAQRVVEAGAGLRIVAEHCTPERLRAAVERILSEPLFRKNAQRLADACARYGGPARAAELLEDFSRAAAGDAVVRKAPQLRR